MRFKKILFLLPILPVVLQATSCKKEEANLIGFDIDLAKEVCKEIGVEVRFEEIVWEQKEIELESKNIDLIWNGLTITEERQKVMEISCPYMKNKQVIVSKDINELNDKTKYTVSFEAGSAGDDLFKGNSLFKNSTSVEVSSQTDALTEVLSGTSDLAIIDSTMAGYYLNSSTSFKNLQVLDYETESEYYGIAARKGDLALINKINETLSYVYDKNKTFEIASKYGLNDYLIKPNYTSLNSNDNSLDYIMDKGYITIGYTVYAPIAYTK